MPAPINDAELLASVTRPHPRLLLKSIAPAVIAVVIVGVVLALWLAGKVPRLPWEIGFVALSFLIAPFVGIIRYYTLSYQIDDSGLRMGVGLINRRESYVTFARVQDIHLDRSLIDRLLGLGTISIQTASGQAAAEVRLFGLRDPELVRDALYRRLRRHQGIDEDEEAAIASLEHDAATAQRLAAKVAAENDTPEAPENSGGTAPCPSLVGGAADPGAELSLLLRQLADETARLARVIQQQSLTAPRIPLPPEPPMPRHAPGLPPPGVPGTSPGPVASGGAASAIASLPRGDESSIDPSLRTPPSFRITDPTDSAEGLP
jgi:putative membrane protein